MTKITLLPLLLGALVASSLSAQIKPFEFSIETLGGQKRTQDDFKNNLVIIDFWGTWCGPCKQAVPGLVEIYNKYKHHGLEIIGLNYKERGTPEQATATVRKFAAEHNITYTLAMGTAKIRKQVIGFAGYPTMLFFKKGMVFDHLEVGFSPTHKEAMETWIRTELGLGEEGAEAASPKGKSPVAKTGKKKSAKPAEVKVPPGVIHEPGHHDTGFEFTVKDLKGQDRSFSDYAGKRIILVLTSTWDHEAANTAKTLQGLHDKYSKDGIAVVAASLELKKDHKSRVAAIEKFAAEHKTTYETLPVGISFLKKFFAASGVPMYLVFDEKGTLILRRGNAAKLDLTLDAIDKVLHPS